MPTTPGTWPAATIPSAAGSTPTSTTSGEVAREPSARSSRRPLLQSQEPREDGGYVGRALAHILVGELHDAEAEGGEARPPFGVDLALATGGVGGVTAHLHDQPLI